jgi:hypothetical protein
MIGSKHDWYNLNAIRAYPFEYSKLPIADTGFEFSDSIVSECMVVVHSNDAKIYLSSIHFSSSIITLTFFDSVSNRDIFMAQCSFPEKYSTSEIMPISDIDVSGLIGFGDTEKFFTHRLTGLHKFNKLDLPIIDYCYSCSGVAPISSIEYNLGKINENVNISTIGLMDCLVEKKIDEIRTINKGSNFSGQKVLIDKTNLFFYLNDPKQIDEICPSPRTTCECPQTPITKINTVKPNSEGNIDIKLGKYSLNPDTETFELEIVEDLYGLKITNSVESIILSMGKSSDEICEETKNIPFEDGRLPSEKSIDE